MTISVWVAGAMVVGLFVWSWWVRRQRRQTRDGSVSAEWRDEHIRDRRD